MKLSSPEFDDGDQMPERFGYKKQNLSPPLKIQDVPEEAESLVLLMDDPDAVEPAGKVWDHWTVWKIPAGTSRIEEGSVPGDAKEGMNDYGDRGYGGPNPPDRTHTYRFRLYAIDTQIDLESEAMKDEVLEAIQGHVIETAELEGKFDPV